MAAVSTSEFRPGLKIIIDGDPFAILENEFVKPGKGQAFNRIKIRNLKNNRVIERTYKSGDKVEMANISDSDMTYLYAEGTAFVFMATDDSFEQHYVDAALLGQDSVWLKEGETYQITIWDGQIIGVMPPNNMTLAVIETEPAIKGDTVTGAVKNATLAGGAVVKVPLFVDAGDLVLVDTRTREYLRRNN